MPLETIPSERAWSIYGNNPASRYPRPETDGARLYPLTTPRFTPGFRIRREDKIFTIGSCFARNIERALIALDFDVESRKLQLPTHGDSKASNDASFFNKYTPFTILNELRWALDPATPYVAERNLVEGDDGKWMDLQLGGHHYADTLERMREFRESYVSVVRRIRECSVLIMTLGLIECWYDRQAGLYLNATPPKRLCDLHPGRFELHVCSHEEVVRCLEEIYAVLRKHCPGTLNILITVSPVPLLATFRDRDILLSNCYSKSTLRSAIDHFIAGKERIDYFPSYEFVTLSEASSVWIPTDYRHVNADTVDRIMGDVLSKYVPGNAALGEASAAARARSLATLGHHDEALASLDQAIAEAPASSQLICAKTRILRTLKRFEDAAVAILPVARRNTTRPEIFELAIDLCLRTGRHGDAAGFMKKYTELSPQDRPAYPKLLARMSKRTRA